MEAIVKNFRPLPGTRERVYRSAQTDSLADATSLDRFLAPSDKLIVHRISLILDLRAPTERDEAKIERWTQREAKRRFQLLQEEDGLKSLLESCEKEHAGQCFVVRLNLTDKITRNTLQNSSDQEGDHQSLSGFEKMISIINEHGLFGLYKMLLGQHEAISTCLKIITTHLEASGDHKVLIHCTQGKDRTGILSILILSVMGVPKEIIWRDYYLSNGRVPIRRDVLQRSNGSAWWDLIKSSSIFEESPIQVMKDTLQYIDMSYGSVAEYLSTIGFSKSWQARLRQALSEDNETVSNNVVSRL